MKFTNGYWLNKPEYDLHFALESFTATITENALRIICPTGAHPGPSAAA